MTALEFLQNRASIPAKFLSEPAPDKSQLREILNAAVAAPDHAALRPWQFIVIEGESRQRLGDVFVEAAKNREPDMPAEKLEGQRSKPLRSPMIVTVVAKITPNHPKTPETEQILSAGAAAQQLMLAANAMGFGAIWLTGPNAEAVEVKNALGLAEQDHIVGFVYLGTPTIDRPKARRPDPDDFTRWW